MQKNKKEKSHLIASNKKASYDYFIEESFEAGISLVGTEVKSLRMGRCNLKESFVKIIDNEAYILGMHIAPYEKGNIFNKDPLRNRKLLLHKKEIHKLVDASTKEGYTIVATKIYFKGSLVKMNIALAKGKKNYDKRQVIAKKDMEREARREFKEKFKKEKHIMAVKKISSEEFRGVTNSEKPVIVDFFADWCGPCKMLAPVLDELAGETNEASIYKLNVDESPDIANEFGVTSIPTLISFKGGKEFKRHVGILPKDAILEELA